jgi:hypothetical protein
VRKKLAAWIANDPTAKLQDFIQIDTADCHDRATKTIPQKWGVVQKPLVGADRLVTKATELLEKATFKGAPIVSLKAEAKWGGATRSRFGGFHYVLVIATGRSAENRAFCVVYDPDVTATDRSNKAWAKCGQGVDKTQPASSAVIDKMILGKENKLGALVRYYYECA